MYRSFSTKSMIAVCAVLLTGKQLSAQNQRPPETHIFSIQDAIAYANKNNVQVKNALLDYKIQEQTNRNVTSQAYPQITGNVGSTYYPFVPVQSFPNFIAAGTYGVLTAQGVRDSTGQKIVAPNDFGFITAPFGTKWNASAGASFSQILFDGQVFVGLQARKTALEYATKGMEVTQETIKVNIYKIYYQLVVSQTQMQQIDANIERASKLLNDSRALYKNGFAERLDADRAEVQLANLQTEKLTTQRSIDNGYLGLKFLMGMPMTDSVVLTEQISEERLRQNFPVEDVYQYADRKEYQYLETVNRLNQYNIKRYKAIYLPAVNLNSNFAKTAYRNQFSFFQHNGDWFTQWNIGLNISIPIFDGFAKASNVSKAKLQLQQSQNQLENLRLSIDNEVLIARNNYTASMTTLESQRKNMALAEEVYDQSKKKFEAGAGSTTDITTAQSDLITAQTNFINALYGAVLAKIDYARAIGKLP
ncbi:MAG: TolC family protein [Bacteroidetes bacterium]|nr:MAG: TolC family protein [Bacteroidota bacterium]